MLGSSGQLPRDFDIEVARGTVPGYTNERITGVNPEVGSDFETLWDLGGNFIYPTAGETWEVVSDDSNDTSAGTGARIVLITGLDDSYVDQEEIVTLNGTTPVTTTRTDWFRIQEVTVISSGSNETNIGNIDIQVSGGGNKRSRIRASLGGTFNGFFTAPAGRTIFIKKIQAFIPKNEDVIIRPKFKVFSTNTFVTGGDIPIYQNQSTTSFNSIPVVPEKSDFELTVKSTNRSVGVIMLVQAKAVDNAGANLELMRFI